MKPLMTASLPANQRLLSGVKPTGAIHIGNYFGALKQWLDLQDQGYECFAFLPDLHALNQVHDAKQLSHNIYETAVTYLSVGLDPAKVSIFRQSQVSAHAELCWIFNAITSIGLLERAHAYKDAQAKGEHITVGTFDYPVLMAADILLYHPDVVPVGSDQQQHVEIANDIAGRFNHLYGQTFAPVKALILPEVATVPGLDGRKMSKSYNNVIGLFDAPEVIRKKVMGITTDSKAPGEPKSIESTLFQLHSLVLDVEAKASLQKRYAEGISYKEAKETLADAMIAFVQPIQARRIQIEAEEGYVAKILQDGKEKAQALAQATLEDVKHKVGLS